MVWYKDLYVGLLASLRRDSLIKSIDQKDYPSGVYVIIVPKRGNSQLEILSARELRHDWNRKNCSVIMGLALGMTEARALVQRMVSDAYEDCGSADIREWLKSV